MQIQMRDTGISPLRRQSPPSSVEMTYVFGWAEETGNSNGWYGGVAPACCVLFACCVGERDAVLRLHFCGILSDFREEMYLKPNKTKKNRKKPVETDEFWLTKC
jgi:hypothetical protein